MVTSYIRKKKRIIINIEGLEGVASKLAGFVFAAEVESEESVYDDWNYDFSSLSGINRLHPSVLSLLPNAQIITIKTNDQHKDYSFPFSLLYFSSIICKISTWTIIQVEQWIKGDWNEYKDKSWIFKVWSLYESELRKEYASKEMTISYKEDQERNTVYFVCERL